MWVFTASLISNLIISLGIVFMILLIKNFQKFISSNLNILTALSVWTLLSLIFLDFIPEISDNIGHDNLWILLLTWLLCFYILELLLHWHHCSDLEHQNCDHNHKVKHEQYWHLILIWTLLHNIFHGIVIFSWFTISTNSWIILTIWILLHSIPENLVNFVMNNKRIKNVILSSFWWIIWVFIAYIFRDQIDNFKFQIIAFTSGWLLYIALSDMLPSINGNFWIKEKFKYLWFVVLWIVVIYISSIISDKLITW